MARPPVVKWSKEMFTRMHWVFKTDAEIAKYYKISRQAVQQMRKKYGVPKNKGVICR